MSRTYRKLTTRRGKPRRGKSRFTTLQIAHCNEKPEPYTIKSGIYEEYEYSWTVGPLEEDRIFVSKGTPMAKPEYGYVMRVGYDFIAKKERIYPWYTRTGRYFLDGPVITKTKILKKYLGPNPEYDWNLSTELWMQQRAFDHHRKNSTGARGSNSHRSDKREKVKAIRLDGHSIVHKAKLDFQHMQGGHNTELCEYLWSNEPDEHEEDFEWFYEEDYYDYEDPYDPCDYIDMNDDFWETEYEELHLYH